MKRNRVSSEEKLFRFGGKGNVGISDFSETHRRIPFFDHNVEVSCHDSDSPSY